VASRCQVKLGKTVILASGWRQTQKSAALRRRTQLARTLRGAVNTATATKPRNATAISTSYPAVFSEYTKHKESARFSGTAIQT